MNLPFLRIFLLLLIFCGCFCNPTPAVLAARVGNQPLLTQTNFTKKDYKIVDCTSVTDIPLSECLALLDFYERTNGDDWVYYVAHNEQEGEEKVFYWFETVNASEWEGVFVTGGNVTDLILDNHNLSGFIPESISDLPFLQEICLQTNNLEGALPASLGELANLEKLSLSNNAFSGELPASLGNLSSLKKISIGNNQLSGSIPAELGNLVQLDRLELYNNQLTGTLPDTLGQLTLLEELIIYGNPLTGLVPSSLVNLSNLYYFYFFATDLCERYDPDFLAWKETVDEWQGTGCICRIYFPILFR